MSNVVVWMDTGSNPWVASCVQALKAHLKGKVPWHWLLAGNQRLKVERLAYDLGMTPVFCHSDQQEGLVEALGPHGSETFLVISDRLILLADWNPGTVGQWKAWPDTRVWWESVELIGHDESKPTALLPEQQLVKMTWAEYESRQSKSWWGGPKALWIIG
ncbi:MAG: hypothetical protein HKM05_04320 [Spirochaetales bacterium]|nr:hypothetical protein [Spirochaetales bacterium]